MLQQKRSRKTRTGDLLSKTLPFVQLLVSTLSSHALVFRCAQFSLLRGIRSHSIASAQVSQQNQTPSTSDEQPLKKLKYSPYRFDSSETSHYSPSSSMLTNHSLNDQSYSQVSNASQFASNPQFASPHFASSSTPSQLVPFPAHPFSMPQSQSTSSIASTSLAQTPSPELSPFFPQLERFLRALHPSLSSLALSIFSAGIDSFEMLCKFNAFESDTLAKFLELIHSQDVKQEISKVHLKLLQKKLEEAKAGGWDD